MSGTAGGKFIISYYFISLFGFHSKEFGRGVISGIYFLGKHCVTFFVGHAHLNKRGHSFIYFYLLVRSVWDREVRQGGGQYCLYIQLYAQYICMNINTLNQNMMSTKAATVAL